MPANSKNRAIMGALKRGEYPKILMPHLTINKVLVRVR